MSPDVSQGLVTKVHLRPQFGLCKVGDVVAVVDVNMSGCAIVSGVVDFVRPTGTITGVKSR